MNMEIQEVYYEENDEPMYEVVEVAMPKPAKKVKKFQCPVCQLMCSSPSTLRVHMRIHTGEKPYKCPQCDYRAIAPYVLRGHMMVHIKTSDRRYACNLCNYRTNYMTSLKVHIRSHTGERPYACTECEYRTAYRNALVMHMARHTGDNRFTCKDCSYSTSHKHSLRLHVQSRHSTVRPYQCDYCSYTTTSKAALNSHATSHGKDVPYEPYECDLCDFKTRKKQLLKRHRLRHTGEKPYKCTVCDFETGLRHTMTTHMRQHTGDRPKVCDDCGEDYASTSSLLKHIRRSHQVGSSGYPYPCFICSERSDTPKAWRDHLAKHGSKAAYQCESCSYSADKRSSLAAHISIKHTRTGSAPNWPCPLCGAGFALRRYLVRHISSAHEFASPEERSDFLDSLKPATYVKPEAEEQEVAGEVVVKSEDAVTVETAEYEIRRELPTDEDEGQAVGQLAVSDSGMIVGLEEVFGGVVYDSANGEDVAEECVIQLDDVGEFFDGDTVQYIEVATDADGQVVYM